jgi:hypothetical protein
MCYGGIMSVTATKLREDIYSILDSVLETGKPVEIERNGRKLRIVPDIPVSRLSRICKRPGLINGDAADLAEIDWSRNWNPEGHL